MDFENKKFYYGTSNSDLDIKIKINPTFKNDKLFEFGNGFYLTEYKNVALNYAKSSMVEKCLMEIELDDDTNVEKVIEGEIFTKIYLHEYEIDAKKLKDIRYCENISSYKSVLEDTIEGYKNQASYSPECYCTYGLLCGEYWDENVNKDNLNESFVDLCISKMRYTINDEGEKVEAKQLCLHKDRKAIKNHKYKIITNLLENFDENEENVNII